MLFLTLYLVDKVMFFYYIFGRAYMQKLLVLPSSSGKHQTEKEGFEPSRRFPDLHP